MPFNNKSILVTGGTGSFGKEFIKTVLEKYDPRRIVVFSRDELKQYEMAQVFTSKKLRYFIGDVRDCVRLKQAMHGVEYVIHAAAMKHVPAAEHNPMECIKTNIYGAENVIRASIEEGVEKVIALSTDKAASPINLYGATKLASDKLFIAANNVTGGHETGFSVVRYGNVVGSRGSVFPLFRKLAKEGVKEMPITDLRMTRFWITLRQGVEVVTKSFERMWGGEIFIPKLPSMKIVDLAEVFAPGLPLKVIGVRPGEKLHEIMCSRDDARLTLEFADHYLVQPTINLVKNSDYSKNALGEMGTPVIEDFEYNSGTNKVWLSKDEVRALLRENL